MLSVFVVCLYVLEASCSNSVDPDQTVPIGAQTVPIGEVWSGFTLFVSVLELVNNVSIYLQQTTTADVIFTCVALAKAGLVVGPLLPSIRPSVCPFIRSSATLLGCLVCVICNSNSFHSFVFKLCLMIVHTLKMCTSCFVHI